MGWRGSLVANGNVPLVRRGEWQSVVGLERVKEKPNEVLARHVVSQSLGLPVRRFEDGKADSQVDAVIEFPDGREAALEIVADHEGAFNAQWAALEKVGHQIEVPELAHVWSAQLARRARVKEVVKQLPSLVVALEGAGFLDPGRGGSMPADVARLGVQMLYTLDDPDRSGRINLHAEGWSGWASSESINDYVERVLTEAADVPAKLAAHPLREKHAFIWTTIGSEYGIQSRLERREQPLPEGAPDLPRGVTHVWVAGSFTSQGVLAWFPERGWWRSGWEWPESGVLALPEE